MIVGLSQQGSIAGRRLLVGVVLVRATEHSRITATVLQDAPARGARPKQTRETRCDYQHCPISHLPQLGVVFIPPAARVAYVAAVAATGVPVVQNPWGGGLGISESELPAIELVNGRVYGLARYSSSKK